MHDYQQGRVDCLRGRKSCAVGDVCLACLSFVTWYRFVRYYLCGSFEMPPFSTLTIHISTNARAQKAMQNFYSSGCHTGPSAVAVMVVNAYRALFSGLLLRPRFP